MIDVGAPQLFACDECGIIEQLDFRLELAAKYSEDGDAQVEYCGCDKVIGEFYQCGYCADAWVGIQNCQKSNKRKTGRKFRRQMRQRHLQKFREREDFSRPSVAPYLNDGKWDNARCEWVGEGSHIRHPKNSRKKVFFKRVSSKKARKAKLDLPRKGNGWHKLFDYWQTLY